MRAFWLTSICAVLAGAAAGAAPLCAPAPEARRLVTLSAAAGKAAGVAATGRVDAAVLFALFADEFPGATSPPDWAANLFDEARRGSLSHYYRTMSGGQFRLTGSVLPGVARADDPAAAYVGDGPSTYGDFARFVREALDDADRRVDFGAWDNDGPDGVPNSGDDDGYVDFLFINTLSAPHGFIRGPATGIAILGIRSDYITGDAAAGGGLIRIRRDDHRDGIGGIVQRGATWSEAVGTMAHEFGHALGLPDLFDLSYQQDEFGGSDDSAGIGYWGVMGHGNRGWQERGRPMPFSAWSLEQLGWIGPANERLVQVDGRLHGMELRDPRAGGAIYRLPSREDDVYYLVELRSPADSYYDAYLPHAGALIWKIDRSRTDNRDERSKMVDLVCADGLFADRAFPDGRQPSPFVGRDNLDFWAHSERYRQTYGGNLGDATDLFDGVVYREFSAVSNPASPFGVSVANMRPTARGLLVDFDTRNRRWSGTIDGDITWRDTVWLDGDVTIPAGAALTIEAGTVILANPDRLPTGSDPSRVELIIDGGRVVAGSATGDPVRFASASTTPFSGDWAGIRVRPSGFLRLENAQIEHALSPLHVDSPRQPVSLARVRLIDSAGDGIVVTGLRGAVSATELVVTGSGGAGFRAVGGLRSEIELSRFADNVDGAIHRRRGVILVQNSEFAGHRSHVRLDEAVGLLQNSRFDGGAVGVAVHGAGDMAISGNRFVGVDTAVVTVDAHPTIEANTFADVATMLRTRGEVVPRRLLLNVVEGARVLLDNESMRTLRAEHNWWGPPEDGSVGARMRGAVDWEPRLQTDPRTPATFDLAGNYPNPFNSGTTIEFTVGVEQVLHAPRGRMRLAIYNLAGQRVRTLVDEAAAVGTFRTSWDGTGDGGRPLGSGVYVYRLDVGGQRDTGRMTLLR